MPLGGARATGGSRFGDGGGRGCSAPLSPALTRPSPPSRHRYAGPMRIVLIAAGGVCALAGIVIGAPTLRLKSDYLALVTLGFGEIIPQFMVNGENVGGMNLTNGTKGINPVDNIRLFGYEFGPFALADKFLLYALLAGAMIFISLRLRDGRLGRAWLAIREDELAASMMGVPLMRTKLSAYAVGAAIGGVGGGHAYGRGVRAWHGHYRQRCTGRSHPGADCGVRPRAPARSKF